MRILVLSINYWPDETGIAAFNIWRCEYLAARGHQVTICTGPPYYPEWRVPQPYRGKLLQREQRNGVTILRSWMYRAAGGQQQKTHPARGLVSWRLPLRARSPANAPTSSMPSRRRSDLP